MRLCRNKLCPTTQSYVILTIRLEYPLFIIRAVSDSQCHFSDVSGLSGHIR